jgi:hypothetical protein
VTATGGDGRDGFSGSDGGDGGTTTATGIAASLGDGVATASATAIGGSGGSGIVSGAGGDASASSKATSMGYGNTSSSANASGGASGGTIFEGSFGPVGRAGGDASASSEGKSTGSGNTSSSANASGGAGGSDFEGGDGGDATATANATASGGGAATAEAVAAGGVGGTGFLPGAIGAANATSSAETAKGALAQAQSSAVGSSGHAQSTAKTNLAGVSVQSSAAAPTGGGTATTNAIARGGSGQAFVNPGQTAYAFSTALPDKAYAASLIGGASDVASALPGPRDAVFGAAILGANTAPDGGGGSNTTSASSTFDFGYGGDLQLGLIDDQVSGFAKGLGFQSMEFTIQADGVEVLDVTFGSLAIAESFFRDDVIDLGAGFGPNIDLTFGTTLIADGPGGFGFDLAIGGAVPEPSTWAMMLVGFAGLGFAGYRSTRQRAAVAHSFEIASR